MECNPTVDHDYCSVPGPAGLDMGVNENIKLKEEKVAYRKEIQELKNQSTLDDKDSPDSIHFYTMSANAAQVTGHVTQNINLKQI